MTERQHDIDFDFFDEGETAETVEAQRFPKRGGSGPGGPHTSLTPLLRLIGMIAFGIFIVVVLVFWVQSCQADSKHDKYSSYMQSMRRIANQSAKLGANLNVQLTTPGVKLADLEERINGLARQQQLFAEQAQAVKPPGPLRLVHQHMVEALQFRESGLAGLAQAIKREGSAAKLVPGAGQRIASQTQRFIASDVVYDDLFKTPAQQVLQNEGVSDIRVPDSNFVQNPALTTPSTLASLLIRIRGSASGQVTGLHGSGLVGVTALGQPGEKALSPDEETKVNVSDKLAFEVAVKNTGDFPEAQIPVVLTIQQSPKPIVMTKKIPFIENGKTATVTFSDNLGANVSFGELVNIKVTVQKVPGETRTQNNSETYKVIFSI